MTTVSTTDRRAAPGSLDAASHLLRTFLFMATFLLVWFSVSPFPDLSDPRLLDPTTQGDLLNQSATVLLTGALAAFAFIKRPFVLRHVVTLPLVLAIAAFGISAVLSPHTGLSARRVLLTTLTIFQASVFLLLPEGRQHFARLLTVGAAIVLAACFLGVALVPQLSIHQANDIAEPVLAGDWRGLFAHKNGAGAAMVLLIFIGIFVCRTSSWLAGILIIIPAGIFLHFTNAKSPFNLLPVVLLLSYILPRMRSTAAAFAVVLAIPIAVNLLTIGSVLVPPIKNALVAVMSDPTFTGRNDIWKFAVDHFVQRPLFGFGFEAFWKTPELLAKWTYLESWGYRASDAHNGYLNLAVTTGAVGLAMALWWIILQTFADYRRALTLGADRALTTLFLQVWLFGLWLSGFESELFRGGDSLWFLMVASMLGIRFQTLARTAE